MPYNKDFETDSPIVTVLASATPARLPSRRLFSNVFQKPEMDPFQVLIMLFWGISFIAFSWNIGHIVFPEQAEIEISQIIQMYATGDNKALRDGLAYVTKLAFLATPGKFCANYGSAAQAVVIWTLGVKWKTNGINRW
jgi:hypothetical protein